MVHLDSGDLRGFCHFTLKEKHRNKFLGNLSPVCHVAADYVCTKKYKMSWSSLVPSCPLYDPHEKIRIVFFTRIPLKITFLNKMSGTFLRRKPLVSLDLDKRH